MTREDLPPCLMNIQSGVAAAALHMKWRRVGVALALASVVAFAVWTFRPNPLDGRLFARLPVRDFAIQFDSVPPDSDGVLVTASSLNGGTRSFLVNAKGRHRLEVRRLPETAADYYLLRVKKGRILLVNPDSRQLEERGWNGEVFRTCRVAPNFPFDSYFLVGNTVVQLVNHRCSLIDLRTWRPTTLAIPGEVEDAWAGCGRFPAVLLVSPRCHKTVSTSRRQFWLLDATGRVVRKIAAPQAGPADGKVDHQGNLYSSDVDSLWSHPTSSNKHFRIWRPSTSFGSAESLAGARGGVFVRCHPISSSERLIFCLDSWVHSHLLHGLIDALRARLPDTMGIYYISPTGSQRLRVARDVNDFAVSSDGRTVYFTRGNQLRMVKVRIPVEGK